MDECLIHSIFNEGVAPGRVAYGRPSAPPPSPPPHLVNNTVESFPLTMLDKASCLVNKRPRVDWFIEQVYSVEWVNCWRKCVCVMCVCFF